MASAARRADAGNLESVPKGGVATRSGDPSELCVETGEVEVFDGTARPAHQVVVMRGSARRISHTAPPVFDAVNARQRPDRHQEIERPEHGRASDTRPGNLAGDLFSAEGRVASEGRCDHARPCPRGLSAGITEPRHDGGR